MRAVQSLHKDSSLTGVWPGHHRDKGAPEFARRQVQRGHPDPVWFMDGAKDSRSFGCAKGSRQRVAQASPRAPVDVQWGV